ncbi:hypothetical protein [Demequina sp. SO4-18]|uniref:hypothetical protein n=1 Tax=Demequina sp. SO4-18 TaxID=3401026 RepID=UPI003B5C4818
MSVAGLKGQEKPPMRRKSCGVAAWESNLTAEQADGLRWAIDNGFPMTTIYREAVKDDGFMLNYDAFRKHFMAERSCPCGSR